MAEDYTKIVLSASITPNSVNTGQQITISVTAAEVTVEPWYHAGDIYSGEV